MCGAPWQSAEWMRHEGSMTDQIEIWEFVIWGWTLTRGAEEIEQFCKSSDIGDYFRIPYNWVDLFTYLSMGVSK